eukprot:353872-Chlamydomonas_euryale.AAC.12
MLPACGSVVAATAHGRACMLRPCTVCACMCAKDHAKIPVEMQGCVACMMTHRLLIGCSPRAGLAVHLGGT